MAHLGMSDDELTTFIKDGFGVDSSFSAKDLFEAAELPSWLSVRTDLGLSKSAGLQLQNALLKAIEARAALGSKRKAAEAPQALPTDGLGRPLVPRRLARDRPRNSAAPLPLLPLHLHRMFRQPSLRPIRRRPLALLSWLARPAAPLWWRPAGPARWLCPWCRFRLSLLLLRWLALLVVAWSRRLPLRPAPLFVRLSPAPFV